MITVKLFSASSALEVISNRRQHTVEVLRSVRGPTATHNVQARVLAKASKLERPEPECS